MEPNTKMTTQNNKTTNGNNDVIKKIMLKDLNPHVICVLCRGYFIDPVTIVECLHSFCKTCIVDHIKSNKHCPICDTQIHKTKPHLSMRLDKALQNIVYKLVPGLYSDEMEKRKKFQDKNEPTKVPKEELEKHFFFCDEKISMSLEYFDTEKSKLGEENNPKKDLNNPNKRYLACPGTVKIQHLTKFIIMKYGLDCDVFVVDVIYKGDVIPQDYTLIDVAYYYKWEKDSPMQFFYRIFKKNKVLLKRRKRKSRNEDKISDGKKPRSVECSNNNSGKDSKSAPNAGSKPGNLMKEDANHNSKNGTNGTDIIGCRTVSASTNSGSSKSKQNPPALRDETSVKRKLQVDKKSSQSEIAKSPPTLTAAVAVNTTPKMSTSTTTTKKAEAKEVQKVVQAKNEIFTTATTTEDEDDDSDGDDNPPSQKKLKIDLENHDTTTIKVKVTANDVKKVEKSVVNNKKVVEKSADIKLKVTANDVKKFEKLAGNSNNPIVKSEKKPEMVSVPSSVVKKEEAVMDQKKPIQKLVIDQNKKPIQNKVIDQKKPIQTSGINGTTTTTNNSVKSTNNSPKSSPNIQQQNQPELVVKPKLTNGSAGSKSRDGNKKLYDIVNNLSKKQASLNNSPNQKASANKDSSIAVPAKPPASLLGGQTTITKKLLDDEKTKVKKVDNNPKSSFGEAVNTNNKKSSPTSQKLAENSNKEKKDNVKGIPSGTSVTVRSLPKSASSSPSSQKLAGNSNNSNSNSSTSTLSFSNSFKSKNGSNSMMDFVQAASPKLPSPSSKTSSSPTRPNGLSSNNSKKSSSIVSDLRQFRKNPLTNAGDQPIQSNNVVGNNKSSLNPSNRTPIIPSLTPGRTLQLGNSNGSKIKTSPTSGSPRSSPGSKSSQQSPSSNNSHSTSSRDNNSSNSSAFSATLSKPIPKPAVTTASLLAQANTFAAMTALSTLGLSYNDPQKALQLLNNMNNMSVLGALSNLNSTLSPPQQPQLPSNRLKLTVTNPPSSQKLAGNSNSTNPMENLLPHSLASHMTAPDTSPWKNMFSSMVSSPVSSASNSLPVSTSGGQIGAKFKTLNQSIRQIPNPSLLTNKQNSDPNTMAIQRVLANQVAAAAAANALK